MALSLACNPDTSTMQIQYSSSNTAYNGFSRKFSPKNSDGTNYDCTDLTGVTVELRNGEIDPFLAQQALTTTSSSPSASGFIATATPNDILTCLGTFTSPKNLTYAVVGSDGTNTVLLAAGNVLITQAA